MNTYGKCCVAVSLAALTAFSAGAQSFPNIGFPKPSATKKDNKAGKIAGAGAGCVAGGAVGYLATKSVKGWLRKEGYSDRNIENTAIGVAAVGCVIGGSIAVKIIENMDAKSREAQDEAWRQAQAQTGPVDWQGPPNSGYSGTSELIKVEQMPGGKKCGTRKDYVKASTGDAEAYTRVCQNAQGDYEKVDT